MPPLDILVVLHGLAELRQPCGHLAGVTRVHAVVPGGGRDEHRRVLYTAVDELVGREGANEFFFLGDFGVAVFA
jgi:hypothetical protein